MHPESVVQSVPSASRVNQQPRRDDSVHDSNDIDIFQDNDAKGTSALKSLTQDALSLPISDDASEAHPAQLPRRQREESVSVSSSAVKRQRTALAAAPERPASSAVPAPSVGVDGALNVQGSAADDNVDGLVAVVEHDSHTGVLQQSEPDQRSLMQRWFKAKGRRWINTNVLRGQRYDSRTIVEQGPSHEKWQTLWRYCSQWHKERHTLDD